jgi:hypothetical protein
MSPQTDAAIIAGCFGVATLIGTVAAQIIGFRSTRANTERQIKQLDRTLAEQITRTLNERFATAAEQLGDDKPPAVRLAGVYAMAGLADDWKENRQTCVNVLCAYLRMPYQPDPGHDAPEKKRLAFEANREVRHTIIRVITDHLQDGAAAAWQGLNFDFTGVVFDGGSFMGAEFSGGEVYFRGAKFSGGKVYFNNAKFSGGRVTFFEAEFSGSSVYFGGAKFSGGTVHFRNAKFSRSTVAFNDAEFSEGTVWFNGAEFSGGTVYFRGAKFSGSMVYFAGAGFYGGDVDFSRPDDWSVPPEFPWVDTSPPGVILPKKEDQSQG